MNSSLPDIAKGVFEAAPLVGWPSEGAFAIPPYFDYVATFTWALSGAIVAARRGYDITGAFVLALLSSLGGGLIRDGVLLQRTPVMLTDGIYLVLIALATGLVAINVRLIQFRPRASTVERTISIIDSIGVPAFAVIGMQLAIQARLEIPGVILVGVVNGVGGGLLRDIVVRDTPRLLQPGRFEAVLVLLACGFFLILEKGFGWSPTQSGLSTMALYSALRIIVAKLDWKSVALRRE